MSGADRPNNATPTTGEPAKYVIINDTDSPQPSMVCQWVRGVGYCYMDRRGRKGDFDGMRGAEATPIEKFGFSVAEDRDGVARFYKTDRPITTTYRDGLPRRWQSPSTFFEWRILKRSNVKEDTVNGK
jgi:hypothetical protein